MAQALPPPQLAGMSIGRALGLTAILMGLQIGLGIAAGISDIVAEPAQGLGGLRFVLLTFGSFAVLLAIALRKASTPWREALPFTRFSGWLLPPLLIAAAGLNILISESSNATLWFIPQLMWLAHLLEKALGGPLTGLILLLLVAPLTEESVFRGLILGGLLRRYRARTAILVSAGLFTLFHVNPLQFVAAFTFGVLAGWVYIQTRSLWPCMIAHALMNLGPALGAIGAFPWEIDGYSTRLPSDAVLFQPLWFDALGAALAGLGLVWLYWMFRRRHPAPSPQVNA